MIDTPILVIFFENVETSLYIETFPHFLILPIFEHVKTSLYRNVSTFLDFVYFFESVETFIDCVQFPVSYHR